MLQPLGRSNGQAVNWTLGNSKRHVANNDVIRNVAGMMAVSLVMRPQRIFFAPQRKAVIAVEYSLRRSA
jgi:hypothetical protein